MLILEDIVSALYGAGQHALKRQADIARLIPTDKGSAGRDIATVADIETQAMIQRALAQHEPNIPFIGEEGEQDYTLLQASEKFVADGIDGTSNYMAGSDTWGVTACFIKDNTPIAGAIYLPRKDLMVCASQGRGCFINGTRQKPRARIPHTDLSDSLIGMEWGFWLDEARCRAQSELAMRARGTHAQLAAIASFGELITGVTDAYLNLHVPAKGACIWDYAAGVLCYAEMMGLPINDVACTPDGFPLQWNQKSMEAIVGHPALVPEIVKITKQHLFPL